MNTIGVVGLGVVGGTAEAAFRAAGVRTRGYDRYRGIGTPADLAACAVVFLCVPTPNGAEGGARPHRGRLRDPRDRAASSAEDRDRDQVDDPTRDLRGARRPIPATRVRERAGIPRCFPSRGVVRPARPDRDRSTVARDGSDDRGTDEDDRARGSGRRAEPYGGGAGQAVLERHAGRQGVDGQRAVGGVRAVRRGMVRRAIGRRARSADRPRPPHRDGGARLRRRVSAEGSRWSHRERAQRGLRAAASRRDRCYSTKRCERLVRTTVGQSIWPRPSLESETVS